jgi:hypothetical protein
MGGEWVKRPKGAKGCEIWRPLVGLGYVRVDSWFQSAEDRFQFVAGCESRAGLKLTAGGFRRIFLEVGVRVWPVRVVGVEFTWAVDSDYFAPRAWPRTGSCSSWNMVTNFPASAVC